MKKNNDYNASHEAQREIRKLILNYEYKPGMRLYEPAIAEKLGMSRTPVREAMTRLVSCGFLERSEGRRGYFVPNLTPEDMRHVFHLRMVLERYAAELVDGQVDGKAIDRMYALNDLETHAFFKSDRECYSELNEEFHTAFAQLTKNPYLIRCLGEVTARCTLYSYFFASFYTAATKGVFSPSRKVAAHIEHRALIDALAHNAFDSARSILREHTLTAYLHCCGPNSFQEISGDGMHSYTFQEIIRPQT